MFLQLCLLIWSAKFSFHNLIKKSFFYDVLLRLLHFRTNPQYSIICQSNFVFIQHSIICEKHLPYYIFALLEVNKMFLQNYYPSKWLYHSKRAYNFSLGTRVFKVQRTQKKRISNSAKRIHNRSISYISIVTSILLHFSFKMRRICLTQKIFS